MVSKFECIQCGHSLGDLVFQDCQDYYLQKPYHATYVRCARCGLLQQSPIPPDVGVFYEAYPIHQEKSFIHRVMRKWVMGACYFDTSKFLAPKKALTLLLDFGCGDGWFLDASRNAKLKLIGFEAEKSHAAHLSSVLGLPIYSDEKELLRDYEGKIDVVTMHFVLEHLTDLNKAFGVVQKLLKPNGLFYFIIPNITSWEARLFGKRWHSLDAPRHISFPVEKSIQQLSERWKFKIARHKGVPFPNGIAGTMPVILTGRFRFSVFLLFLPLGVLIARIFPTGTAAYWLNKNPEAND